jgi:hypothetical protein
MAGLPVIRIFDNQIIIGLAYYFFSKHKNRRRTTKPPRHKGKVNVKTQAIEK